jgi:hypothetical protein
VENNDWVKLTFGFDEYGFQELTPGESPYMYFLERPSGLTEAYTESYLDIDEFLTESYQQKYTQKNGHIDNFKHNISVETIFI